jgi:hypothetical protein
MIVRLIQKTRKTSGSFPITSKSKSILPFLPIKLRGIDSDPDFDHASQLIGPIGYHSSEKNS